MSQLHGLEAVALQVWRTLNAKSHVFDLTTAFLTLQYSKHQLMPNSHNYSQAHAD